MSYDVNMRSLGGNIMATCMFIGNHEASDKIYLTLLAVTEELILTEKVSTFYVGNNGAFDRIAQKALFSLKQKYPEIKAYTILSYIPGEKTPFDRPKGVFVWFFYRPSCRALTRSRLTARAILACAVR